MSRTIPATAAAVATAAITTTLAAAIAPAAHADLDQKLFSNADNTVRCHIAIHDGATYTKCVSEKGRAAQPECAPPDVLIPSVSIEPKYTGVSCWNQGFGIEPAPLKPLQTGKFGTTTVISGFSGNLYAFDVAKLALVRAGNANKVLFALR